MAITPNKLPTILSEWENLMHNVLTEEHLQKCMWPLYFQYFDIICKVQDPPPP